MGVKRFDRPGFVGLPDRLSGLVRELLAALKRRQLDLRGLSSSSKRASAAPASEKRSNGSSRQHLSINQRNSSGTPARSTTSGVGSRPLSAWARILPRA